MLEPVQSSPLAAGIVVASPGAATHLVAYLISRHLAVARFS